ncbi:MAG: hypothetical protein AB8B99_10045 [Phormidesmis sp.]
MTLGTVLNPSRKRRRYRNASVVAAYVRQGAIALIAFLVAAFLLNRIIPSPTIPSNVVFIGPKYEYYQAHKDDYNALFFGSSRIYSHVIPDVFDETAQSAGVDVNSYNFGVPAMRAIDSAVLLKEVLKNPPKDLQWVFFESILDKGYEPIPNARTYRAIYWHNWENTRFAARYILTSDESLPKKAVLLTSHLIPFLYHQLNVGRVFNQVLPSELSAGEQAVAAEVRATEGYYALQDENDPKRQAFLANQSAYAEQVAALSEMQAQPDTQDYLSENKQALLREVTQAIRAAGAEPIFVEPPSLHMVNDFQAAQQVGAIDTLLSYKDPNQFPQLYGVEQRADADHLNDAGSRVFTRLLAEDFSEAAGGEAAGNSDEVELSN